MRLFAVGLTSVLALSACAMNREINNLEVHDLLLYGARQERITWFYGTITDGRVESALKVGTQTVALRAQLRDDPLALPGTLSVVSGNLARAAQRGGSTALSERFSVSSPLFSGDLNVTTRARLEAIYYTDGRSWFKLSGRLEADRGGRVSPLAVSGLRGVGELTDAEADLVSDLLRRDGPLAVGVLPKSDIPDAPLYVEPSPVKSLQTGLVIQKGVPANLNPFTPPLNPPNTGRTLQLGSGGNAAYTSPNSRAILSRTFTSFESAWRTANGNVIPVPGAPSVDFSRFSVATFFLGQKPSGGYGVSLQSSEVQGDSLILNVSTSSPRPGLIQTQALTSPWLSVRLEGNFRRLTVRDQSGATLAQDEQP